MENQIYFSSTRLICFVLSQSRIEDLHRPKHARSLLLCVKRNISQTFKCFSCKKFFPSVYVFSITYFNEHFLFHVITGRLFLYKFIVTQRFFATITVLHSLKQVFERNSCFAILITQNRAFTYYFFFNKFYSLMMFFPEFELRPKVNLVYSGHPEQVCN